MPTLEMVEKLKEKANVSYDEAKTALETCNDDLLEALIYLEKQGKVRPPEQGGFYSTQTGSLTEVGAGTNQYSCGQKSDCAFKRVWNWFCKTVHKGNTNKFEVMRKNDVFISMPVTVLAILILFCFWITLPLLIIGLFFGCKYRFSGPETSNMSVNDIMDSAAKAACDIKKEVLNHEKTEQ